MSFCFLIRHFSLHLQQSENQETVSNMHVEKIIKIGLLVTLGFFFDTLYGEESAENLCTAPAKPYHSLTENAIAEQLGWVQTNENRCGGYYLEAPFVGESYLSKDNQIKVTGNEGEFSFHGTSTYEGNVVISKNGQQIITNKAYVYRNPTTEKLSSIDLVGHVTFREPNNLVIAKCGHLDITSNQMSLNDILYRTAIYGRNTPRPPELTIQELQEEHKVYQLSAWGQASGFKQEETHVYEFQNATYSTCPPLMNTWKVEADDIVLNKETGRGTAKHAKLYFKKIPVFYIPYLNFPIDARRQSGFLWPTPGSSSVSGPSLAIPYYLNLAPNYDDTIKPVIMEKRGLQINNLFRYIAPNPLSQGELHITVLPNDQLFKTFKNNQIENNEFSTYPVTISELNRLENASDTRYAFSWQNKTYFNEHWSGDINYNYVSDDYYLKDFSNNLNQITPNQLLQQGDIYYKSQYWQFTGRVQAYQTLHPIDENPFYNQYIRLPQLILDGNYPDDKRYLNYTILNEVTHFDIANNPGNLNPNNASSQPIGERMHTQPGINVPIYRPSFYFDPRLQFAFTQYELQNMLDSNSSHPDRALPIFDVHAGLFYDRDFTVFKHPMRQTLEPQIYYTYVPFRDQMELPVFDTTLNTLTYDQLFTYNRFNGIDRIGDANQLSVGVTSRLIDDQSGYQKASFGIGQILYFANRRVTLCENGTSCTGVNSPDSPENTSTESPISAVLTYNLNPHWNLSANTIWNTSPNHLNNQSLALQYVGETPRFFSLNYAYVRNGDPQLSEIPANNLSQTDMSFSWPISRDWSALGRWTQDWNQTHFHNLLYGLQYDTCCWAIRLVAGRTFNNLNGNTYQYNTEFFIQFALKGLGSFGSGSPATALNNGLIASESSFGQDY